MAEYQAEAELSIDQKTFLGSKNTEYYLLISAILFVAMCTTKNAFHFYRPHLIWEYFVMTLKSGVKIS
jgi:hypothetical protein